MQCSPLRASGEAEIIISRPGGFRFGQMMIYRRENVVQSEAKKNWKSNYHGIPIVSEGKKGGKYG